MILSCDYFLLIVHMSHSNRLLVVKESEIKAWCQTPYSSKTCERQITWIYAYQCSTRRNILSFSSYNRSKLDPAFPTMQPYVSGRGGSPTLVMHACFFLTVELQDDMIQMMSYGGCSITLLIFASRMYTGSSELWCGGARRSHLRSRG